MATLPRCDGVGQAGKGDPLFGAAACVCHRDRRSFLRFWIERSAPFGGRKPFLIGGVRLAKTSHDPLGPRRSAGAFANEVPGRGN
jgi:hypothetical protein